MLLPPQPTLQQGDIIDKLFFPAIGQVAFDFVQVVGNTVGNVLENLSPADELPQNVLCILPVMRQPALIVSQTCDLRLGEQALVAPLFPLLKSQGQGERKMETRQAGKLPSSLSHLCRRGAGN